MKSILEKAKIYSFKSGKQIADLPSEVTPKAATGGIHDKATGLTGQIVPKTLEGATQASFDTEKPATKEPKSTRHRVAPGKIERVIFHQGDDADEALGILNEHGKEAAMKHLQEAHYPGEHETSDKPGHGSADRTYSKGGYTMSWNHGLNYIGLEYKQPKPKTPSGKQTMKKSILDYARQTPDPKPLELRKSLDARQCLQDLVKAGCDQCNMLNINGMNTHETGCSNAGAIKCEGCGESVPKHKVYSANDWDGLKYCKGCAEHAAEFEAEDAAKEE